jgi:DDE family transposase
VNEARCVEAGLVKGEHMSVDGSFIQANADHHSRVPREQLPELAKVNHTVREYLAELERENPVEAPVAQQEKISTTDPDSIYATKGGPARLGYYDNYLVDNHSCVIVGVQATAARMSQETVAAQDMLTRFAQWQGREPESVAADTTYGNGEFLQWLADRSIIPYMRTRDSIHRKRSPFYGPEHFTYEPENNRHICPAGQPLNYGGRVHRNRAYNYIGTRKRCDPCSQRPQCTSAAFRSLIIHQHEPARQRARELEHARVRPCPAAKKEGGSLVRGTEESSARHKYSLGGGCQEQLRVKIVSTPSEQAIWRYNRCRFRSQKGNPG